MAHGTEGEASFKTTCDTTVFSISPTLSTLASMSDDMARTTSGNGGGDVATPFVMPWSKNWDDVGIEGGAECGRSCIDGGARDENGRGVGVHSPFSSNGGRFSDGTGFSGSPQRCKQLLECKAWVG